MTEYLRTFGSITRSDRELVGGKCASLGDLIAAGARVPIGVAITTAAFHEFVRSNHLASQINEALREPDDLASSRISDAFDTAPIPSAVADEIVAGYSSLGDSLTAVAVRSSAVAEDANAASFAGMQETVLWVRGPVDLMRAVRRVWASAYSAPAIAYRRKLKVLPWDAQMAVGVQRMVDARVAGVLFTISPRTGDRSSMAINASWGLGTTVVGGEVTPDEYWVDKVTEEVRRSVVSDKSVWTRPSASGDGTVTEAVPDELRRVPCLTDAEIGELVRVAKRLEVYYGHALDIEWALANHEGFPDNLYVLQARPETVWSNRTPAPVIEKQSDPIDYVMRTFLPPGK